MNPNRVDMTLERSPKQWSDLLHAVKVNSDNILNKEEQKHYVSEIEFKLGIRNKHLEVLKNIEAGMADIDDLDSEIPF